MSTVQECRPYFKSGLHEIDGEATNNTLEKDDELSDYQLDDVPDDGEAEQVKTEDDALPPPCEGRHRSRGVIVHCCWATHGAFCDCSRASIEPPMPATASKRKVTYVVPIRKMKSVEITQEEYNKFYESTVNNNSLGIFKERILCASYLVRLVELVVLLLRDLN